jgi:AraC-like DNA-binding protein
MLQDIYEIIRIITVFQFTFFAFFLIFHKKGRRISNMIFSVFLFSKALCFSRGIFMKYPEQVFNFLPEAFYVTISFEFLLGPALYFYVRSLAYRDFKFKKIHLLHLIPFLLHWIFMTFNFYIYSPEVQKELLVNRQVLNIYEYHTITVLIYVHFMAYTGVCLYVLSGYKNRLKELYSSIEHVRLSWLNMITFAFLCIWGISFINYIARFFGIYISIIPQISIFLIFLFGNIIVYKGLKHPDIFNGIEEKPKYAQSKLTAEKSKIHLDTLLDYMKKHRPYLTPGISIEELSQKLSIHPRYISQEINFYLNKNFYDFINEYRIEEAKNLFSDPANKKKTILEILYEVGFNSKSVFNNAFKKHTGVTPTEFRSMNQN